MSPDNEMIAIPSTAPATARAALAREVAVRSDSPTSVAGCGKLATLAINGTQAARATAVMTANGRDSLTSTPLLSALGGASTNNAGATTVRKATAIVVRSTRL